MNNTRCMLVDKWSDSLQYVSLGMRSSYSYRPDLAVPDVSSVWTHLRCHVLLRKASTSASNDQVRHVLAICEAGDCPLNIKDTVRDYPRLRCSPSVAAILSKNPSECRDALVSRWVLARSLGDHDNGSTQLVTHIAMLFALSEL